jgi:hypothetical protein
VNGVAWDVRLRNASGEDASCGPFCRKPLIIAKAKGLYIYIYIYIYVYIYVYLYARLRNASHSSVGSHSS